MPNKEPFITHRVYLRRSGDPADDCWVICNRIDPGAVAFEANIEKVRKYFLSRWTADKGMEYYGSGENHGWHSDFAKAHLFGEESFAGREWGSQPRDVRAISKVDFTYV